MNLADHARAYSKLGWALVELDGKMPLGYGWQQTQPLDPQSAGEIWSERDGSNMGLVLGPSGVIDFELDGGDEELYWQLAGGEEGAWPKTPVYRTGSGRPHVLFRDPGGLSRRTRDGMELRAGSHQSVIPPSIHPDTGNPYEWVIAPWDGHAEGGLADPPQALLEFFAERPQGDRSEHHWREPLRGGKRLGEGEGRYGSLLSYLGATVNQATSPDQLAAMAIAYSAVVHDPPYDDETITKHAFDLWVKWHEEPEESDETEGLIVMPASELVMRSISFLWRPFLQRSAFHLFVGRKGAGKGTLLTWLAAQMTQGQFEDETERGVLWISTEDSFEIDIKPRFLAQGGNPDMLFCVRQRVLLPLDEGKLRASCLKHDIGMVIVDPIISTLEKGGDANDEASVISAIGCLNALADELQMTILGVRHLGKSLDRSPLEAVLGSAAWINTPRAVLGLAQDEDSKIATLEILAGNRVRGRVSFDFKIDEASVAGVEEAVSKASPIGYSSASMAEILKREKGSKIPAIKLWLLELLSDGKEYAQEDLVPECVERFGVGRRSLQRACGELKDSGEIRYIPNGPSDPATGRKLPGFKWHIVRAVPEDL